MWVLEECVEGECHNSCVAVENHKSSTTANLYSSKLIFILLSKWIVFNSNLLVTYGNSVHWLVVASVRVCQNFPF